MNQETHFPRDRVCSILTGHQITVSPQSISYYPTPEALAEKVRSSRSWSFGETFVFAPSKNNFLILCQVAPASCEMLTVGHAGFHDVITAYRYSQEELVAQLASYFFMPASQEAAEVAEKNGHLVGPFGSEPPPSCDSRHIRVINADLGEGKPYAAIAEVISRPELSQDENLATAELFRRSPDLRDMVSRLEGLLRKILLENMGSVVNGVPVEEVVKASEEARQLISSLSRPR